MQECTFWSANLGHYTAMNSTITDQSIIGCRAEVLGARMKRLIVRAGHALPPLLQRPRMLPGHSLTWQQQYTLAARLISCTFPASAGQCWWQQAINPSAVQHLEPVVELGMLKFMDCEIIQSRACAVCMMRIMGVGGYESCSIEVFADHGSRLEFHIFACHRARLLNLVVE